MLVTNSGRQPNRISQTHPLNGAHHQRQLAIKTAKYPAALEDRFLTGRGVRLTGLLRCRKTPLRSCRGRHAAAALNLGVPLVTRNTDDPTDSATNDGGITCTID